MGEWVDGKWKVNGKAVSSDGASAPVSIGNGLYSQKYKGGTVIYDPNSSSYVNIADGTDKTISTHGGMENSGTNWQNGLMTGAEVVNALSGLAGAYTGLKGLDLAEDQFDWSKASAQRNLENQGLAYNTDLSNRAKIAAAGGGLSSEQTQKKMEGLTSQYVDTSRIG